MDWLSLYEMHKVLPIYVPRGFVNKGIPTGESLDLILSSVVLSAVHAQVGTVLYIYSLRMWGIKYCHHFHA